VRQVAAWGVVTVQYDTPTFTLISVASELRLFPHLAQVRVVRRGLSLPTGSNGLVVPLLQCSALLSTSAPQNSASVLRWPACLAYLPCCLPVLPGLQWVADQNDNTASPMYGLADVGRMAVGGHSRGGKLAALAFTGEQRQGLFAGLASNAAGSAVFCVCLSSSSPCQVLMPCRC
jgi:hypothetical protein